MLIASQRENTGEHLFRQNKLVPFCGFKSAFRRTALHCKHHDSAASAHAPRQIIAHFMSAAPIHCRSGHTRSRGHKPSTGPLNDIGQRIECCILHEQRRRRYHLSPKEPIPPHRLCSATEKSLQVFLFLQAIVSEVPCPQGACY